MATHDGVGAVAGIGCGTLLLIWFVAKVVALPVFIIQALALIGAAQAGTVGQFDFTWFVISLVGLIVL